jgi:hypothetical protein
MVCFICQMPASAQCKTCDRFVCTRHTDVGRECTRCSGRERRSEEAKEQESAFGRESRRCAFCGRVEPRVPPPGYLLAKEHRYPKSGLRLEEHQSCGVCGRFFCDDHGTIDVKETATRREVWHGGDWPSSVFLHQIWLRCKDHPKKMGEYSPKGILPTGNTGTDARLRRPPEGGGTNYSVRFTEV